MTGVELTRKVNAQQHKVDFMCKTLMTSIEHLRNDEIAGSVDDIVHEYEMLVSLLQIECGIQDNARQAAEINADNLSAEVERLAAAVKELNKEVLYLNRELENAQQDLDNALCDLNKAQEDIDHYASREEWGRYIPYEEGY